MIHNDKELLDINGNQHLYIYGAKSIGNIIYEVLLKNQRQIKGFIVSQKIGNLEFLHNLPIFSVYEIENEKKRASIIVAVMPQYRKEIVNVLLALGFHNIITLNDKYIYELKSRKLFEDQHAFYQNYQYELIQDENVEVGHAVLIPPNVTQFPRWRVDLLNLSNVDRYMDRAIKIKTVGYKLHKELFGNAMYINDCKKELNYYKKTEFKSIGNIFRVRCHLDKPVKDIEPKEYIYDIQAGAALTNIVVCPLNDKDRINISEKNQDFSECSAIYWIWKNQNKNQYTGLYHYRRQLNVTENEFVFLANQKADFIHSIPCVIYPSVRRFFLDNFLYESDWNVMMEIIQDKKPEYYEKACKLSDGCVYLANNIFVMRTEWFDKMCNFVFDILLEIDHYYNEIGFIRQDRYAGYLFEILYSIFVIYHAREMNIVFADMKFIE